MRRVRMKVYPEKGWIQVWRVSHEAWLFFSTATAMEADAELHASDRRSVTHGRVAFGSGLRCPGAEGYRCAARETSALRDASRYGGLARRDASRDLAVLRRGKPGAR